MEMVALAEAVPGVMEITQVVALQRMHKMVLETQVAVAAVEQLINGHIHPVKDVQQMVVVEKLLLDGLNKSKSKNIIWDILQK
jgi:hypothetical protein